jgi:hypothetical protein
MKFINLHPVLFQYTTDFTFTDFFSFDFTDFLGFLLTFTLLTSDLINCGLTDFTDFFGIFTDFYFTDLILAKSYRLLLY